jgi:hypothetical protein
MQAKLLPAPLQMRLTFGWFANGLSGLVCWLCFQRINKTLLESVVQIYTTKFLVDLYV